MIPIQEVNGGSLYLFRMTLLEGLSKDDSRGSWNGSDSTGQPWEELLNGIIYKGFIGNGKKDMWLVIVRQSIDWKGLLQCL